MTREQRPLARSNAELTAETTSALIREARIAFARDGYDRTSVESVAERAGLSKGAVYYHFRDKPGLFEAAFRSAQAELVDRIEVRARAAGDPRSAVIEGCRCFLEVATDGAFRQIILVDAPTVLGWAAWRRIDREFGLGSLEDGLRACESGGMAFKGSVEVVAHALTGVMNECVFLVAEARDVARALEEYATLLAAVLDGLIDSSGTRSC